jgi:hypothetical protein
MKTSRKEFLIASAAVVPMVGTAGWFEELYRWINNNMDDDDEE